MKQGTFKKILSILLIIVIFSSITFPLKYRADEPVDQLQLSFSNDLDWLKVGGEAEQNHYSVDVRQHFSYLNAGNLTVTAKSSNENALMASANGSMAVFTIKSGGKSIITLTATDGEHEVTDTLEVDILQLGDATGDGVLTPADSLFVYQVISGKVTVTDSQRKAMDMNGDGQITAADAVLIMQAYNKNTSQDSFNSFIVTFTNQNDAPVVLNALPQQMITVGSLFSFHLPEDIFVDVDEDDQLAITAVSEGGNSLPAWLSYDEATHSFEGTPIELGEVKLTLNARDLSGESTETSLYLKVASSNQAPTVTGQYPEQLVAKEIGTQPLDISTLFTDADGDQLTYTVSSLDESIAKGTLSGSSLMIQPTGMGFTKLKITANDGTESVDAFIDVHAVELVPNGQLNITTKKGVPDVTVDLSQYFPPASGNAFTQIENGKSSSVSGKTLVTPINFSGVKTFWVISPDHKAMYITINSVEQSGEKVYFSEFLDAGNGRAALEIFNQGSTIAEGYELEVHRYVASKNSVDKFTLPLFPMYPNMVHITIDSVFYDFFDVTNAAYFNEEIGRMSGSGVVAVAFILKKNGQVIDVMGTPNGNQTTPILKGTGTIVRKKGISSGSSSFQLVGEWDQYPAGTFQYMGYHQP